MQVTYSKPSSDINIEFTRLLKEQDSLRAKQNSLAKQLTRYAYRLNCCSCNKILGGSDIFKHREIDYFICVYCHHIQSCNLPPKNFPYHEKNEQDINFSYVYPKLSEQEYKSRYLRVYKPKLDWVNNFFKTKNYNLQDKSWLEIGSGAGYFLYGLEQNSYININGIDQDEGLLKIAKTKLKYANLIHTVNQIDLLEKLKASNEQIITAFFVLEHLENLFNFWKVLAEKPKGSIFIFSVPVFSFATLLESAFTNHLGRNLDNTLHTQLFTDKSINYGLKMAGYAILGQWIFGQDAHDMTRMLMHNLQTKYPASLLENINLELSKLIDPMQNIIDTNHFADARHIIAIKE